MAQMTPQQLAEFLRSKYKGVIGVPIAEYGADQTQTNFLITDADLTAIANADDLSQAYRLATELGVSGLEGDPTWMAAKQQVEADEEAVSGPVLNREDVHALNPIYLQNLTPEARQVVLENQQLQAQNAEYEALYAAFNAEEETDITYSPLLFPNIGLQAPDQAAHLRMVTSDEYDPWGNTQKDMSTRELIARELRQEETFYGRSGDSDLAWEKDQYSRPGGYVSGSELLTWTQISPEKRSVYEDKFVRAGLLDAEDGVFGFQPGAIGMPQMQALRQTMAVANYYGVGIDIALDRMIVDQTAAERLAASRRGPGAQRASFSVPASLRQIPDYESIQQEVHNLARQRLGRDLEDWEIGVLADQMKGQYQNANAEKIKAARAAFYQAQSGKSGVMEVEVPDPQYRAQKFIEERYGAEIGRNDQVQDTAATNRIMIDAITRGGSMVGG